MLTNAGKYLENGGVGYLLKPKCLRDERSIFNPEDPSTFAAAGPSRDYTVEICAAFALAKPDGKEKGEVIDPYVVVTVQGVGADQTSFCTKHVNNNGYDPKWNEEVIQIYIYLLPSCMLHTLIDSILV